jgi:hypothetical protein
MKQMEPHGRPRLAGIAQAVMRAAKAPQVDWANQRKVNRDDAMDQQLVDLRRAGRDESTDSGARILRARPTPLAAIFARLLTGPWALAAAHWQLKLIAHQTIILSPAVMRVVPAASQNGMNGERCCQQVSENGVHGVAKRPQVIIPLIGPLVKQTCGKRKRPLGSFRAVQPAAGPRRRALPAMEESDCAQARGLRACDTLELAEPDSRKPVQQMARNRVRSKHPAAVAS